ncbi:DUF2336 domain-containing protein [Sphingomonas sp. S2-65]|uniref:DUF2336 domain-containing protein n=1 Tax=Sphingomonas sp. S2-65 TaxID=2903960 RepID=UPI001F17FD0F|nr:DUF2336 domain-containing protein [Sphingomonas sp. S2-65]UYY58805.1 DUF2336 domain-containing protein [Sphingomonas sp. S2-65]
MSDRLHEMRHGSALGAGKLLARAVATQARAARDLKLAIDDFFLPEAVRLGERLRSELALMLERLVDGIETGIRGDARHLLAARGESGLIAALERIDDAVYQRLTESGLLRDAGLMAELIARVRQEALAAALPMHAPDNPEQPSLLNRFSQNPDRMLANGAVALLMAESRRRGTGGSGQAGDLPPELQHRLTWWVAAAIRETTAASGAEGVAVDRVLSEAALRSLAAYDEGDRLEDAALRFAAALDAPPDELAALLIEALGDGRVVLFIAILAHGLGVGFPAARDLVLDPAGEGLWVALRALDLPRGAVAQIGYALCEADARRGLEQFADRLDEIMALDPIEAGRAVATLRLHPDYCAAILALAPSGNMT